MVFAGTIPPQTPQFGKQASFSYGSDLEAIYLADFDADSFYTVVSYRLATDILDHNASYDKDMLEHGLTNAQLKLIFNPDLFISLSNPLSAIRAIRYEDEIDTGWYRLYIVPAFSRRTRRVSTRYK